LALDIRPTPFFLVPLIAIIPGSADIVMMTRHHISPQRIPDFASEKINFTDKEAAHFELCHVCRLKVRGVLRNQAALVVRPSTQKPA
jgi:hypothetical protein